MQTVVVSGAFDDLRSPQIRFLEEAAKFGALHVLLWPDEFIRSQGGKDPKFPYAERQYLLQAIRYVEAVFAFNPDTCPHALPPVPGIKPGCWVVDENNQSESKRSFCEANGLGYRVVTKASQAGFPIPPDRPNTPGRKKVIVTGCYDWFHSGHVRFFEEVSALGDLYVSVGSDANVRLLKGDGHPLFPEEERRYIVGSIRFVHQCLIGSGHGWLDAEPEIRRIKPDIYAVNEDGDKPEKRRFCEQNDITYQVLKRTPKEGLVKRQSTTLRGF